MNAAAHAALSNMELVEYIGPINPPSFLYQKVYSKLSRVAGFAGDFFFFSERRLDAIAKEFEFLSSRARSSVADTRENIYFFHGFTPWIKITPNRPYIAWSDCTFRDYIDVYHRRDLFRARDLARIELAEAMWLRRAAQVIFTSRWAMRRATQQYALEQSRVRCVGIFGEIEMPEVDAYSGAKEFAFVSTNFEAKGGRTVIQAFQEVRKTHPDASLTIVGDAPVRPIQIPGVKFEGFLHKEIPSECEQLRNLLGRARALVHPTRSDICPLLLVEAGYFGCPAISSFKFAIPELVDNGRTGILLNEPNDVLAVATAMRWMLDHEDEYQRMRTNVWTESRARHSKSQFERNLLLNVHEL